LRERLPEPIGLIRVDEHCLFTWVERGSRRVVQVESHHCEHCVAEVQRLGFGLETDDDRATRQRRCVLVVDDDSGIRESLKLLLDDHGYQTYTARDGEEALELLAEIEPPVVILLDLIMPRMDGRRFLSAKKASPLAAVPVVVITALDLDLRLDSVDFLQKPFSPQALLKLVSHHAARAESGGG